MTELTKVINNNGEVMAVGVAMVKCGCAVEQGVLDLCVDHKKMTEAEAIASINADYGIIVEESIETTTTKEEVTMIKQTPFQALKAKAVAMGIDIKGLNSTKKVQAAIDAFVPVDETVATTTEPVTVELNYTGAITEYATDLLELVINGTDYKTLAKRVSVNAYSILGAQALSGVELTKEQKQLMARHGVPGLGLDKLVTLTTVAELKKMSGTQLYIFALKIGAKPKLEDIESLRGELITLHAQATRNLKPKASEASRANKVSTNNKTFKSARVTHLYPNAVIFIADGQEYTYIINEQGKGVLRRGNNTQYMQARYLKGLLYNINTKESRYLVKALGNLRASQPNTPVGGASAKEKNSTAKNN